MANNYEKIRPSVDVDTMQQSDVTVVGGAVGLIQDLVRCGLQGVTMIDFDSVDGTNPARQDFRPSDVGRYKVDAAAAELLAINREVDVEYHRRDFCEFSREEIDEILGGTDLIIMATDFFPAQARGNVEAIRLSKPTMWIGLYRGGRAGEIVYYVPGLTPACYRCVCEKRYTAVSSGEAGTITPSYGGTILDLHLVDAIAGQIAVGILTRGADNRMGRLVDALGDRNLLQVKIDPGFCLGDIDIFGQYLGNHPANFSFTTIALPMARNPGCPDCSLHHRHASRAEQNMDPESPGREY